MLLLSDFTVALRGEGALMLGFLLWTSYLSRILALRILTALGDL